jgi:predicted regulator of Ras-like GTPase activity (Roadblock/LC7/MglB family)
VDEAHGFLHGFSLPTFLQLLELERKTCGLRVRANGNEGRLAFHQGRLVDAQSGALRGREAAYEIVAWPEAEIRIEVAEVDGEGPLVESIAHILLDGCRLRDEDRRPAAAAGMELLAEGEMNVLQETLDKFKDDVPEFVSTDIVNFDSGLSIGGRSLDPDFDASVAAASYAEVVKSNRRALELLGLGAESGEDILITTSRVYLLIRLMGAEYYHFLAITRKGNLGLARAIMKKYETALLRSISDLR